jgi:hypothetical protein
MNASNSYRIDIGNEGLDFKTVTLTDPVPLGRQILAAGFFEPVIEFSLLAILPSGDFEDLRLDEPYDLRARGVERFIAFKTDREFKFTLQDKQLEWGKPVISGAVLYRLGNVGDGQAVFLQVPGGEDRLIERTELINLAAPGIERFIVAPLTYEIIVNTRERTVPNRDVTFEQIRELAYPGPHEPNVIFSMTYRHAASTPHAGELSEHGVVQVKRKGTIFNVKRTVQS